MPFHVEISSSMRHARVFNLSHADLLAKVAARDPADLHRITNAMLAIDGVVRTSTAMSLVEVMPTRTLPLLQAATGKQ